MILILNKRSANNISTFNLILEKKRKCIYRFLKLFQKDIRSTVSGLNLEPPYMRDKKHLFPWLFLIQCLF